MSTHGGVTKTHKAKSMDEPLRWVVGIIATKLFAFFAWIFHRQNKIEKQAIINGEKIKQFDEHMREQRLINRNLDKTLSGIQSDTAVIKQIVRDKDK